MRLIVKRLDRAGAHLPERAHPGDAGLDLFAAADVDIPSGEARLVGTGLAIELPPGTEGQIRPRSGLALRHAVTVLNAPGTVDAGYRGEIGILLVNHGREAFRVRQGMKVAQLVVTPVVDVEVVEADALSETSRAGDGFGSTG